MSLPPFLAKLSRKQLHDIYKKITGGEDIVDSDLDDVFSGIDEATIRDAMLGKDIAEATPEAGPKGKIVVEKTTPYKMKPLVLAPTAKSRPVKATGKAAAAPAAPAGKPGKPGRPGKAAKAAPEAPEAAPEAPGSPEAAAPAAGTVEGQIIAALPDSKEMGFPVVRQHITPEDYYPNLQRDSDLIGFIERPHALQALDLCFKTKKALMFIGEAGSGKSTIGKYWAYKKAELGTPIPYLAISADGLMSINQLFGTTQIKDGSSYYLQGKFTAFTQMPSLILIDEVTALDPTKNFVFHQLLAERKFFVREENHTYYLDPNCMIIFAGNPMDPRYPGVGRMNLAFADRMATVLLEAMTIAETREVLKTYVDTKQVKQADFDKLMTYTETVREFMRVTPGVKGEFSMRSLRRFLDFLSEGVPERQAMEWAFINTYKAFDRNTYDNLMTFTNNHYI